MQNEITSIQIGKKLKMLRHQHGWNQSVVAMQLHISVPAYSKIESGTTIVNMTRLKQMADLFSVTILDFMTNGESGIAGSNATIVNLRQKISEKDVEIIKLQVRAIELHEEVRNARNK